MAASEFRQVIEKYNPYHGKDGRFTSGGSASMTVPMGAKASRIASLSAQTTAETSGSTISTKTGYVPKAGFMVAVDTDRSKVIRVDLNDPDVEKKLAGEIKKYMSDNKDLLGQNGKYLGTWQDNATGDLYLDVSTHVKNKAEAIALGQKHNQIAIWDVKNMQEINTGGTGEHVEKGFEILKSDDDKRFVFGWANVSIRKDGEQIHDYQGDMIDPEELETAAYEHVLKFRSTGERHDPNFRGKGKLIESVVFTKEKQAAMGIPEGTVPTGWWVGYHIDDDEAWEKIKKGEYRMFSIEGRAEREPVEKAQVGIAKLFKALVEKFNPYHDKLGRFSSAGGAASFTWKPGASVAHDKAIEREKKKMDGQPFKIIGKYEQTKYANEDFKRYEFTSEQKEAIRQYTGHEYEAMNDHLRKGDPIGAYGQKLIEDFSGAIDKTSAKEAIVTYRGLGNTALNKFMEQGGAKDANDLVGAVITDKGFVSTSFSSGVAKDFAHSNCLLEINVPKGSKALMPNGMSTFENEVEVTLQRGARFKITGTYNMEPNIFGDVYTVLQCDYISP